MLLYFYNGTPIFNDKNVLNLQVSVSFLKKKNCWIGRKFGARNGNAYQIIREFFVLSECLICYINRKSQLDKLND